MISRWFPLTLFAVVFAPGLLHAQQSFPDAPQRSVGMTFVVDALAGQNEKMYEDIEVFRRILDRKLTPLYPSIPSKGGRTDATIGMLYTPIDANTGSPYANIGSPWATQDAQHQIARQGSQPFASQDFLLYGANIPYPATISLQSLEGIYLKGHGVVYTATLSSLQPPAKTDAGNSDKVTYDIVLRESEWDSIRRQVRNEKEKPKKPEESKPPSLSDVLLKVLAENGHHFSQLAENESLTIVLTVHEENPSSPAAKSGKGSTKAESKPAPADSDADRQREARRNLELLGELHLKQAKYNEAIIVFQRLLQQATSLKQAAEARRKLSQCYLMQGQDEKALDELDQAIQLMRRQTEAKGKPAPGTKTVGALPVKLIISAPKKLLNQVKEGKISFEDFRRQASVESLRFGDRR